MKRFTITILAIALSFGAFSQEPNYGENKDLCLEKVSLYSGYLKQKQYKDAYKFWKQAVKVCPEYKANLYANGAYILKQLSKDKTLSKEQRKIHSDSIAIVYAAGIKIFGGTPDMLEDYGAALIIYSDDYENGVNNLKEAIDGLRQETRYSTMIYYSQALAKVIASDKKDCEEGVKEYERLAEFIEMNKGKAGYDKAQEAIDKYLGPCLTCDKLVPLQEKKWEEAKTDMELANKIVDLLDKRGCTDNEVYKDLLERVINSKDDPTPTDFMRLAQVKLNDGKKSDALKYIEKAADIAGDDEKESILEKAADVASSAGSTSKAMDFANELLKINPNNGTAYLVKAAAMARSSCPATAFEQLTNYWVAYDLAAKAKSLDPSVADKASRLMSSYRSRFPEGSELFAQGLKEGQSYTHCSGVSTTVRAK